MQCRAFVLALALATPGGVVLAAPQPDMVRANPTEIAVYMPPSMLDSRGYSARLNLWVEPGKALSDALRDVGQQYFPHLHMVPDAKPEAYGLLVDMAPKWKAEPGKVRLTIQFDVYGVDGKKLLSDTVEPVASVHGSDVNTAAFNAARIGVQQVMAAVQSRLSPTPTVYPATGSTAKVDFAALVDRKTPYRTGTGFYINTAGQLLTAAHVARDCTVLEANQNGSTLSVVRKASSDLLDVAILDSGKSRASALPLREGYDVVLGEAVTSVGYPLHGLLGDSPNVTRGNLSANQGIRGSLGMLQFSAPIQPGNSGGPIVSDNGELLGVTVGTLSAEALAKQGLIPQNVNFALDARYVAKFLQRENVTFDVIKPKGAGSMQAANEAALSNTVQINCYE